MGHNNIFYKIKRKMSNEIDENSSSFVIDDDESSIKGDETSDNAKVISDSTSITHPRAKSPDTFDEKLESEYDVYISLFNFIIFFLLLDYW
jgi:hypothetical protein